MESIPIIPLELKIIGTNSIFLLNIMTFLFGLSKGGIYYVLSIFQALICTLCEIRSAGRKND